MRVAIVGTGYLGRTVVASFKDRGIDVVHTYHRQKHLSDSVKFDLFSQNLNEVVSLVEIDTVVFASLIESSPNTEAVVGAMRRAFSECRDKRVVYVSTDAVFDGKSGHYVETDAATPATAYGRNKKLCEDLAQKMLPDCCIVRPSYIYGFSLGTLDSRLNDGCSRPRRGQTIKKFIDMFKSPAEVNQLAETITRISASDFRGVLHACGKRLSVYEFFRQALNALGEQTVSLEPDHMPEDPPPEYLRDSSLDSTLLKMKFGLEPVPIDVALSSPTK